ncbi:MAG: chemotaxis protein CheW [Suilimivivens sp.]
MDQLKLADLVEAGETAQYIVTKLGAEQYGIDIKYIDNIVRMQHITRVPKVANYLKGVINLRGEIIPVMSIRLKMGLADDEITKATRIIILKLEQHGTIGVIVDEVKEVVTLSADSIEKVSHNGQENTNDFIFGIGKHGDELISLLDLNMVAMEK